MKLRFFLAGILFLAASLPLVALDKETVRKEDPQPKAAEKDGKEPKRPRKAAPGDLTCALHVTWWDEPQLPEGERLEMAIQAGKDYLPVLAGQMQIGPTIDYVGPGTISIVRKAKTQVEELDKKGKTVVRTVESWVPFATCVVPAGEPEVLILLMLVPGKAQAVARAFDINPEKFPFGSFHILNFSKARVGCSLGGKVFFAEPGQRAKSPTVISQRQVMNFRLAVFETGGAQHRLYSTPIILDERTRRLYFVTEYPGMEIEQRYDTRTLVDYRQVVAAPTEESPAETTEPKGKAPKAGAKAPAKAEK